MKFTFKCNRLIVFSALLTGTLFLNTAQAADEPPLTLEGSTLGAQTGEKIYQSLCQACHQMDAKGATGAGFYPALAENSNLTAAAYPMAVVLHGKNGMPPFRDLLSDEQVAEVINYVRSHFGNQFTDKVTAADVAKIRDLKP